MSFRAAGGPRSDRRSLLRRLAAATLAGAAALSGTPALAVTRCGMSPTHEAFDVQGLKSELMVTALSCGAQDRYNAFVEKFRPGLNAEESELKAYFTSTYGRSAQKQRDDYITQLANVESERGLQAGTQFCDQRVSMFDEVAALDSVGDLGGYAEAKDIVQPTAYDGCAVPARVKESGRVRHARGSARHGG